MNASVLLWLTIAVLLFWWMGAYNRLVRLRSQGITAFAALEALFNQHLLLVKAHSPQTAAVDAGHEEAQGHDDAAVAWHGLVAAAGQFNASLKAAHAHPLNGATMRALRTAFETLSLSWSRLQDRAPDLAGPALPSTLQAQWAHVAFQVEVARAEFNRAVVNYNEAIAQFPALLLAWVFGFKPAQPI